MFSKTLLPKSCPQSWLIPNSATHRRSLERERGIIDRERDRDWERELRRGFWRRERASSGEGERDPAREKGKNEVVHDGVVDGAMTAAKTRRWRCSGSWRCSYDGNEDRKTRFVSFLNLVLASLIVCCAFLFRVLIMLLYIAISRSDLCVRSGSEREFYTLILTSSVLQLCVFVAWMICSVFVAWSVPLNDLDCNLWHLAGSESVCIFSSNCSASVMLLFCVDNG